MNTVKNILFFGLLLAVLCGVYLSLSRRPQSSLPEGLGLDDTPKVKIEMGSPASAASNPPAGLDSSSIPALPAQPPGPPTPPASDIAPTFHPTDGGQANLAPPQSAWPPPLEVHSASQVSYPSGVRDPFNGKASAAPPSSDLSTAALPAPPTQGPQSKTDLAAAASQAITGLPPPPPAEPPASAKIDHIMQEVKLKVSEKRFGDALSFLSLLYGNPDLTDAQAKVVTRLLDQLSAKVIYSREDWMGPPYFVQAGDTLDAVAERYHVPALVLRINGIRDPQNLRPGTRIKVINGPFSAEISTDHSEMTLRLADRYAVRFSVRLSNDLTQATSLLTVRDKRPAVPGAGNGTGKQWIELGGNAAGSISIEGTNDSGVAGGHNRSTIWLSERDMDDLYGMLSVGSSVIIKR